MHPAVEGAVAEGDPAPRGLFGLAADEADLLAEVFGDMAGRLGLDGRRILDALGRGETLGQALGLPPRLGEVLYGRAHTWFSAGRFDRAETLFRVLTVMDGRQADHWVGYGICLRKRDAAAEAVLAFATAAALRPDWAVPQFHAADLAASQRRWADAADHLAAFAARDSAAVPEAMRQEANRLRRGLQLRAALRDGAGTR